MMFHVSFGLPAVALLLLAVLGAETQAVERPLSLDEAIALALEKNESIWIERKSLASAEAGVSGAKGAYDPVLELDGGYRRATEPANSTFSGAPEGELSPTVEATEANAAVRQLLPTGGEVTLRAGAARRTTDGTFEPLSPSYSTQLGVELRQPLLRDRGVDAARLNVRVATAERSRSAAALRREIVETVAAVESAYWRLAAARRAVEVRAEAVRLAEEQLSLTQIRIDQGVTPQEESAQPRAELERRRGELLDAQELVARAENALKLLILGDTDVELWSDRFSPTEDFGVQVASVDIAAAMERALASRPELEAASAAIERRHAEADFARDGVWPQLDAVAAYDRFGLSGSRNSAVVPGEIDPANDGKWGRAFEMLGEGHYDDLRVGLEFSIPIRNRTARAAAATARNAEEQANAELARARKAVRSEVLDAAAALESAGQRLEAARAGREAAEVQLSSEQERFAVGLSTNFLVLTRQNDLSEARLAEISAQTDYRTARTEMARVTGSLLEERRIDVDATMPSTTP
jgi:HAE1 family hydrophobic/amphiphilic exporter-1